MDSGQHGDEIGAPAADSHKLAPLPPAAQQPAETKHEGAGMEMWAAPSPRPVTQYGWAKSTCSSMLYALPNMLVLSWRWAPKKQVVIVSPSHPSLHKTLFPPANTSTRWSCWS